MILHDFWKFLNKILHCARKVATILQDPRNHCKCLACFTCKNLAHMQDENLAQDYALELVQESCKIRIECIHLLSSWQLIYSIIMPCIKIDFTYIKFNIIINNTNPMPALNCYYMCILPRDVGGKRTILVTVQNDY